LVIISEYEQRFMPFEKMTAPEPERRACITGYDVAELRLKILVDPAPHISKSYRVTGPELKDMHESAENYAAALGRKVTYVPEDVETWDEQYVDSAMAAYPHMAEHLTDLGLHDTAASAAVDSFFQGFRQYDSR
jgi:uncharacterized protein YbjT (DUF2867 family)